MQDKELLKELLSLYHFFIIFVIIVINIIIHY